MNTGDWIVIGLLFWVIGSFPILLGIGRWVNFVDNQHTRLANHDD